MGVRAVKIGHPASSTWTHFDTAMILSPSCSTSSSSGLRKVRPVGMRSNRRYPITQQSVYILCGEVWGGMGGVEARPVGMRSNRRYPITQQSVNILGGEVGRRHKVWKPYDHKLK